MHKFIASFAVAAAFLGAGPALAADPDLRTVKVRHADLNLASAEGRAKLEHRITAATETACGSYAGASIWEQDAISRCRAKAQHQIATQLAHRRAGTSVAAR